MLYQLPNGKVIHLSIDEYLDLTDLDIQYLMSIDYGDTVIDPFSGSAINGNVKEIYYHFWLWNTSRIGTVMLVMIRTEFNNPLKAWYMTVASI